jgi:hypothetical protein
MPLEVAALSHVFALLPGGLRRSAKTFHRAAHAAPLKHSTGRLTPLRYQSQPVAHSAP